MEECPTRWPMKEALMALAATSSRIRLHALSTAVITASRWTGRRWLSWPVTWRTNVTPSTWNTGLSNQRGGAWWHTFDSWMRVFSRGGLTVPSQRYLTVVDDFCLTAWLSWTSASSAGSLEPGFTFVSGCKARQKLKLWQSDAAIIKPNGTLKAACKGTCTPIV